MTDSEDRADNISLGTETVKGVSAKFTQAVLGFVGTIIFARILGPTSFGGFYFLLAITQLTNRPVRGVANAVKKRFSEIEAPQEELVGLIILTNVILVGTSGLLVVSTDYLANQTNVPMGEVVFLAILVATIFFFPFQSVLQSAGRPGLTMWIDTGRSVLTLGLQLLFISLGLGAAGMGYGLAGATILLTPATYYFLQTAPAIPQWNTIRSVWMFARYSIPEAVVGEAYNRFDILLLGALIGSAIVGQYEVGAKLTLPAVFLSGAITVGLMPKISGVDSRDGDPTKDASNAISYASALSIPILFGAVALSERLVVTVYGSQYTAAAPFLIGLALYRVFVTQSSVYKSILTGIDEPRTTLKYSTVSLVVNLILGVSLLLQVGPIGVVAATIVAEATRLLLFIRKTKQHLPGIDPFPSPLAHQLFAGAVMSVAVLGIKEVIPLRSWVEIGLIVGIGGVVYTAVMLAISRHARTTLTNIWRQVGH